MTARVLVIGAGVGGVSAALWLRDLAIPFDWIESRAQIGGTLLRVGNLIDELPAFDPIDGPALAKRLRAQLEARGLAPILGVRAHALTRTSDGRAVQVERSDNLTPQRYDAVVLATGTEPRLLGLPNEEALLGRGVELSVTRNRERYAGKHVAVVGGGDAALEGALLLRPHCDEIHLIHRRDAFRAQRRFVEEVTNSPQIRLHLERKVRAIEPTADGGHLAAVRLDNDLRIPLDGLFVRLGVAPAYPRGASEAPPSAPTYLQDDAHGRGPLPGTYVVGDVSTADHQSVAWAVGSASRAVLTLSRDLGYRAASVAATDADTPPTARNRLT